MYNETEIPVRKNWVLWLATFKVNESRLAAEEDMKRLRVSISANFHAKNKAKFLTKQIKEGEYKGYYNISRKA
jgi:hypothetical protein